MLKNRNDLKGFLKRATVFFFFFLLLLEIIITLKIETLITLKAEYLSCLSLEQNKNSHKDDFLFGRIDTKYVFVENLRRYMSQIKESISNFYSF